MALFPTFVVPEDNIYLRWGQRYISEGFNKKFLGFPIGIHKGFLPEVDSADPGNKINLTVDPTQGYSLLKVKSTSNNIMIDIYTDSTVSLDFSGHIFVGSIYVIARAGYATGANSTGEIFTRSTPGDGITEVTVCRVNKPGLFLNVAFTDVPTDRHLPTAHTTADFGYMTSGSQEALDTAVIVRNEVIAARTDIDTGFVHPDLSARLTQDYSTVDNRLGKALDLIQGNVHAIAAPVFSISIADSLSSGTRTFEPIINIDPSGLPGIGTANDGVISLGPDNVVPIIDSDTGRKIYDSNNNPIFGRFVAPNVLSFHRIVSGIETTFDFTGLTPINIKPFLPVFMPLSTTRQDSTLKLLKSYINDPALATTTNFGVAEFAPDGGTVALTAVQGSDTRLVNICKTDGSTDYTATQSYTGPVVITANNHIPDKSYADNQSVTVHLEDLPAYDPAVIGQKGFFEVSFGAVGTTTTIVKDFAADGLSSVQSVGVGLSALPAGGTMGLGGLEGFIISGVNVVGTIVSVDFTYHRPGGGGLNGISIMIMAGGNL